MNSKKTMILLFSLLLAQTIVLSQDSLRTAKINKIQGYPLTRDIFNRYPDSVIIEGKIIDYTLGFTCGIICGCGTLKIQLLKYPSIYQYHYIYVAVGCLSDIPEELKKRRFWVLYKLPITENSCFYTEAIVNKFDTKGMPFYILKSDRF